MRRLIRRITLFTPLLFIVACDGGGDPSSSYSSTEISPTITITEDQKGDVLTLVQLQSTSGSSLYLSDGDTLYASLNTPPYQLLSASEDLFSVGETISSRLKLLEKRSTGTYYTIDNTAGLPSPVRAYVAFIRGSGEWTGQTGIELPTAFSILNPAVDSSISRSVEDPITLSWTNTDSATTMEMESQVICNGDYYPQTPMVIALGTDTGTVQLNTADYFPSTAPDMVCHAVFTLKRMTPVRYISSELGTAAGSSIQGIQKRTIEFTSTP